MHQTFDMGMGVWTHTITRINKDAVIASSKITIAKQ
jgi:hypothetical protein